MFEGRQKRTQKCEIIEFPDELRHQKMPINANRIRAFYRHLNKKVSEKSKIEKSRTIECGLNAEKHKIILCKHSVFMLVFSPHKMCLFPNGKFHFDADTTAIVFSTRPPENSIHFTFTKQDAFERKLCVCSIFYFAIRSHPTNDE